MSSRKRRQTGDVSTIKLPTPTTNTTLVNRLMPIQTLTRAFTKQILKEEKVRVILEHLQEWQWSFSDLSLV